MEQNKDISNFIVGDLPTLIYIPDFITDSEQIQLLTKIYGAPLSKWKPLKNRRLQNWGGVVHGKGLLPQDLPPWLSKMTQRIHEESGLFPSPVNHVLINEYLPNQGIMPHQDGPAYFPVVAILSLKSPVVMDFIPHPRLKMLTSTWKGNVEDQICGGETSVETDQWKDSHHPFSVLLMPRSLLIFKDDAYSEYLHGIRDSEVQQYDGVINKAENLKLFSSEEAVEERSGDARTLCRRACRISLTCRLVPKVHKSFLRL